MFTKLHVYTNIAAVTNSLLKIIKQQYEPVEQHDILQLNAKLSNNLWRINFTEGFPAI